MTFTQHLTEFRDRLVRAALAVFVGFFVAFAYRDPIFGFVAEPMRAALAEYGVYNFRAIEITETIFVYLKMSVVAGIIFTLPLTFYQLWSFIAPGLLEKEKQAIAPLLFFSTFFFLLGAFFAYSVIIPFMAKYLAELTLANESVQMDVTVASAFNFSLKLIVAFGVAFELPLIMFFMSLLGLMTAARYAAVYRYFIVVSFIVSAIFTPPDPISQLLMAVPLNLLYWVGVAASWFTGKRREKGVKIQIQSRVWAFLSLALAVLGLLIATGTWYLGRSDSPMRWVPPGSVWVASVHVPNTLGSDAPAGRTKALRDSLGLPEGAPEADWVIRVRNGEGQSLTILARACEDTEPSVGTCAGDDLLIGDAELVEAALDHEGETLDDRVLKDLSRKAPAWLWHSAPQPEMGRLLPGQDIDSVEVADAVFTADLRGLEPHASISIQPKQSGLVTAVQARADSWRADQRRLAEAREALRDSATVDSEMISLFEDLLLLGDERFALSESGIEDKAALKKLSGKRDAIKKRLAERRAERASLNAPADGAANVVGMLGDGVRDWRTIVDGERAELRMNLAPGSGVDGILRLMGASALE
ncbi:MAG: sec-independent protein translocase protein TatC [Myxococcota bacterium]|jgi:sec-independent protein translocase protein TatC